MYSVSKRTPPDQSHTALNIVRLKGSAATPDTLLGVEGGLVAQAAGSRAGAVEVTAESGRQKRAEDDVGTPLTNC